MFTRTLQWYKQEGKEGGWYGDDALTASLGGWNDLKGGGQYSSTVVCLDASAFDVL